MLLGASAVACAAPPAAPPATPTRRVPVAAGQLEHRRADYARAREAAHAWLDRLAVDPVDLQRHRVAGIKQLGRILLTYAILARQATDDADAQRIGRRVAELAAATGREEYHALATESDGAYEGYLLVRRMLGEFGLDTSGYDERLRRITPLMDGRIAPRDNWERRLFVQHYASLGLDLPPVLTRTGPRRPLAEALPLQGLSLEAAYDLTHEVFVPFDYGLRRVAAGLPDDDRRYLRHAVPLVLAHAVGHDLHDLAAEALSCMTYLGLAADPGYARAVDFLLRTQRPDGSWGDYEQFRAQMGAYLDQHIYLHTTSVALVALVEVFHGGWDAAP